MSSWYIKPSFGKLEDYVQNGLAEDDSLRGSSDEESDSDVETVVSVVKPSGKKKKAGKKETAKEKEANKMAAKAAQEAKKRFLDWEPTRRVHTYDAYPAEVKVAARYRDGLTAHSEAVGDVFDHPDWASEYKKHSEIVFRYLRAQEEAEEEQSLVGGEKPVVCEPKCGDGEHVLVMFSSAKKKYDSDSEVPSDSDEDEDEDEDDDHDDDGGDDDDDVDDDDDEDADGDDDNDDGDEASAIPEGLCRCSLDQFELMQYHISNCEGYQSQSFMREKIFRLLDEDVHKMPKQHGSTKPISLKLQTQYLQALNTVLWTLQSQ